MTEAEFNAWLRRADANRMVLIEVQFNVGGLEVTRYLASREYSTGPDEVPPNTRYIPRVSGGVAFVEKLTLDNDAGLSGGDIELDNQDGGIDSWLQDVCCNRSIKIWNGEPDWPRADFRLIFDGIVDDIANSSRDKVNLLLSDKMQRLNTPISETKLGGTSEQKDEILPIPFGENHNVTPLLTNKATLEYGFLGSVESSFEVRTNGKPIAVALNNQAGRFNLLTPPQSSMITVSVQGDNGGPQGYAPRIAPLVRRIATGYGKAADRFTDDDIDLANFAAFDAAHPQPVGVYVADRANQAQVIQDLAASVGAQAIMSRLGKLKLVQLAIPAPGTPVAITPAQMRERTIHPVERPPVVGAVKIGFDKNWTVQENLQTSIPEDHAALYAMEWLTETVTDPAVLARYRRSSDPAQQDTYLKRRVDANAEAQRRLDLYKVQRVVYEFEGTPELMTLELGMPVTLQADRFVLDAVPGVVVMMQRYWLTGRVTVGVMV